MANRSIGLEVLSIHSIWRIRKVRMLESDEDVGNVHVGVLEGFEGCPKWNS